MRRLIVDPAPGLPTSHRDHRQGEQGAVAIVVALLLVALFGLGALVIDIGALYQERSEMQNGADAAALALAYDCVAIGTTTACTDNPTTRGQAEYFASANSSDAAAEVLTITFDDTTKSVLVEIGTLDESGSDEIEFVLAPVLGSGSATVVSAATTEWGLPVDLPMAPFGIGLCEWEDGTNDGDDFGVEQILFVRNELSLPLLCTDGPGGGFGYLATSGDCQADIADGYTQGQTILDDPLDALGCAAGTLVEKQMYVPIFDDVDDGTNPAICDDATEPCYRIYGYAAFELAPTGLDVDMDVGALDLNALALLGLGLDDLEGLLPSLTGQFVNFVALDYLDDIDATLPDLGLNTLRLAD